jgi:flavin reductase (DIM6/NTAB) family NADH-FMN oxidoreductase RutF
MPDINAQTAAEAPVVDTLALRSALGQFATGVCIVAAPAIGDEPRPFAITVNSFASVSLDPPMVLWCVQKRSTTYDLWMATERFAISVLHAGQAHLCNRYAIRGNHSMPDGGEYRLSASGTPLINDAVATFDCRVHRIHDAGDHSLILADVVSFASDASRAPLIYLRGGILG